jgi:hypothetical protein
MRNQIHTRVLGLILVALLSATVPAGAATRDDHTPGDFLSRLKSIIAHILDVDQSKITLPPG